MPKMNAFIGSALTTLTMISAVVSGVWLEVAVTVTVPTDTAFTTPFSSTVAIVGSDDVQVTVLSSTVTGATVAFNSLVSSTPKIKVTPAGSIVIELATSGSISSVNSTFSYRYMVSGSSHQKYP